jgi:hypothetical protein
VVGLGWSNDPESYAGSSVHTGKDCHGRQVKGDYPDKRRITWSYRLGVGRGGQQPRPIKICFVEKLLKKEKKIKD